MNNYIITTDTTTDLPEDYIKKHDLGIMSLTYTLEGTTYSKDNPLDVRLFYEKMRNGSMPTTSQVNPENAKNIFLVFMICYQIKRLHLNRMTKSKTKGKHYHPNHQHKSQDRIWKIKR